MAVKVYYAVLLLARTTKTNNAIMCDVTTFTHLYDKLLHGEKLSAAERKTFNDYADRYRHTT